VPWKGGISGGFGRGVEIPFLPAVIIAEGTGTAYIEPNCAESSNYALSAIDVTAKAFFAAVLSFRPILFPEWAQILVHGLP